MTLDGSNSYDPEGGTLEFRWNGPFGSADRVGHSATASAPFTVAYDIRVLFDPWWPLPSGIVFPVALRLCDINGRNKSSFAVVITALGIVATPDVTSLTESSLRAAARSDTFHYSPLAARQWRGRQVIDELAGHGILIRSPSPRGVAEEAPGAYKDVTAVVDAADRAGLSRKVARLEPRVCVKV